MDPTIRMKVAVDQARATGQLGRVDDESLEGAYYPLALRLARSAQAQQDSPRVVALVGPPGSGKSTLSAYLSVMLEAAFGLRCAAFGSDDVFLGKAERQRMASEVHPLFAVRGAPGCHHLDWALETFDRLRDAHAGSTTLLPRFDKMRDDTMERSKWPVFVGRPDLVLFDTWIWDLAAPSDADLVEPLNSREAEEDPDGVWRHTAAQALRTDYLPLFDRADEWVRFEPPSFDAVVRFREEQERANRAKLSESERRAREASGKSVRYFLELFQRWISLPHRSEPDHRIQLDDSHRARLLPR